MTTVDNKVVQSAIISHLATFLAKEDVTFIRPNKLRKMICKQIPTATWTQFAECLETVLKDGENSFQMDEKNENIVAIGTTGSGSSSAAAAAHESTQQQHLSQKEKVIATKNVQVPRAIALHLNRKGGQKKRNLETNSKTKLTIHGIGRASEGLPLDELVTVQITRYSLLDSGSTDDESELAKKHIKTAKLLLEKMAHSYKKHPDHFGPKKAGGTLEEQEQQKQLIATLQQRKKHNKHKDKIPIKAAGMKKSKRRKEKFY